MVVHSLNLYALLPGFSPCFMNSVSLFVASTQHSRPLSSYSALYLLFLASPQPFPRIKLLSSGTTYHHDHHHRHHFLLPVPHPPDTTNQKPSAHFFRLEITPHKRTTAAIFRAFYSVEVSPSHLHLPTFSACGGLMDRVDDKGGLLFGVWIVS